jgi:hypothetical protein
MRSETKFLKSYNSKRSIEVEGEGEGEVVP